MRPSLYRPFGNLKKELRPVQGFREYEPYQCGDMTSTTQESLLHSILRLKRVQSFAA